MALTDRHAQHAGRGGWRYVHARLEFAVRGLDPYDVASRHVERRRRRRIHLDPGRPSCRGDRVGRGLQPRIGRFVAAAQRHALEGNQVQRVLDPVVAERRLGQHVDVPVRGGSELGRPVVIPAAAVLQQFHPAFFEVAAPEDFGGAGSYGVAHGFPGRRQVWSQVVPQGQQDVAEAAAGNRRRDHRLLETHHVLARRRLGHVVAPLLERVGGRQHQVGMTQRLAHDRADADDERNRAQRVGKARGLGHAVHGVGLENDCHVRRLALQPGVAAPGQVGEGRWFSRRRHGAAQIGVGQQPARLPHAAHHVIQQHGGESVVQPVGAGQGRSAGDGETGLVAGELAGDLLDSLDWHAGSLAHTVGRIGVPCIEAANLADDVEPIVRRRQSLGGDDLRDGQRQRAFLAGVDVDP